MLFAIMKRLPRGKEKYVMTHHLSLRLSWHNDGWNGHICTNPEKNIHCVGPHSYPSNVIAQKRNLAWESAEGVAGCHCSKIDDIPPCSFSINAFGTLPIMARADPPDFFNDNSGPAYFELPPATACIWPYEQMYAEDVLKPDGSGKLYDYEKRLEAADEFFNSLTPGESLVFYYVNKSNPFSQEDNPVFPVVGISIMKSRGDFQFYENVSPGNKERYAGGYVWQLPITCYYPEIGFRIPYQKYLDDPEVLAHITFIPENQHNFKFAARRISDDDALIYVEKLIVIVDYLISINDDTENWPVRKAWLQNQLVSLWKNRGTYPGLISIFQYLKLTDLIEAYYTAAKEGKSKEFGETIIEFLNNRNASLPPGLNISSSELQAARRTWITRLAKGRELAWKVLSRIDLTARQVGNILSSGRIKNSISATLSEIVQNPYLLVEQYVGDDYDDSISFSKIDHGVLPSPELGVPHLMLKDDWRRLRALMVDELHYETTHAFVSQRTLLDRINGRLSHYPEWKREVFNESYIEYDKEHLESAIVFREDSGKNVYCYNKQVYEDERLISNRVKDMVDRGDLQPLKPFTREKWISELVIEGSLLAKRDRKAYMEAMHGQVDIGQRILNKPLSIVSGSGGTGKTHLIGTLIKAIKHSFGKDGAIGLLAPTGKAADRIRQNTGYSADTIHSFLMKNGWLNDNFTYKRKGLTTTEYTTIIIDECSMIDLSLMATLFRAINWHALKRIIFVGDPNQLPPIGRGKVFADIIAYVRSECPPCYGKLQHNIRQMENKINDSGNGIIELSQLYISENIRLNEDVVSKAAAEQFLKRIQEGEEEVDKDLRIVTWKNADELETRLKELIDKDKVNDDNFDISNYQIISPYRNELFGIANLNSIIQRHLNANNIASKGTFGGLTKDDKIIQVANRAKTNAYRAYNNKKNELTDVNVYNGELGKVNDLKKWNLHRELTVTFERKEDMVITLRKEKDIEENIELAYAISVHKAQGSEFRRVYLVLPKRKSALISTELLYTGITRACGHLTILIEEDYRPLFSMRRPERSKLAFINSSIFNFHPVDESILSFSNWYEEGKIYSTLTEFMVRSKSEVIIANMLATEVGAENFLYEEPLAAPDGTLYLPDFTIRFKGRTYYWEHVGRLDDELYKKHWKEKEAWYNKHFPGQLLVTYEGGTLSTDAMRIISDLKSGKR